MRVRAKNASHLYWVVPPACPGTFQSDIAEAGLAEDDYFMAAVSTVYRDSAGNRPVDTGLGFIYMSSLLAMARRTPSLSMVVPALNEEVLLEEFIRKSMRDLAAAVHEFEIVLVDDGSTDRTLEIARRLAKEFSELRVLSLGETRGTGLNYIAGFQAASKEWIFSNTVDSFFDTCDLPQILLHLRGADVVSGYRTDLKANSVYQKCLSLGNYYLIRLLFRMPFKAYQTLQFHRREFLQGIPLEARSSFLSPELLFKARRAGKTIKEVPVVFHPRVKGVAKGGKPVHVWRTFQDILRLWFRWIVLRKI